MTTPPQPKPKILIIGGGFGGIRAARQLAGHHEYEITLISASDHFAYYPQLYHAATGGVRSEAAIPYNEILVGLPVQVVHDTISSLDPVSRTVTGVAGTYQYDELILALGSVTNYFGIQGLAEFSYDIKTIEGAERFKQHLHADLMDDQKPDLNYIVVGGGPTGVELSAALGTYLRRIMRSHKVKPSTYQISLIEASPRVLPRSPESMSARVQRRLEKLGVKVITATAVQGETADSLQLANESLPSHTVVWTAGVANNPFYKANGALFTLAKNGKVQVNEFLQAHPNVYVIGDNAATQYAGMAQTAISDADFVAANIVRTRRGHTPKPYQPKAPVSVIPIGERWAATQWGKFLLYGYVGYALRRAADLIGYADVEGWSKAIGLWLQDGRHEDNCAICARQSMPTVAPTPQPPAQAVPPQT